MGLAIYFATLWFGLTIVGDTAGRSAVMAGVVLLIAATGFVVTNRGPKPPAGRR
jgi:hypothetical protein